MGTYLVFNQTTGVFLGLQTVGIKGEPVCPDPVGRDRPARIRRQGRRAPLISVARQLLRAVVALGFGRRLPESGFCALLLAGGVRCHGERDQKQESGIHL